LFKRRKQIPESESEQLELAKKDARCFGPLYEKYFGQIFRFIFKRVGGREEIAGDLAQMTFMKAMSNLHRYEDRGLPFSAWLYRIAQNEVNMFFRQQKGNYYVDISSQQIGAILEENGESGFTENDLQQLVTLINGLEESQADLLELRFFQQMSFKEIADIYGIPEANAKMRIYRLLEKIRQQWKRAE
jgi:RNA polymerase sigma-70 factor, ECF subfamily